MALTLTERRERREARKARDARIAEAQAEALRIVRAGVCPYCGDGLRRNLSITGWWQCAQFGAVGFRADSSRAACSFQAMTGC